jgi:uncharacterized protein
VSSARPLQVSVIEDLRRPGTRRPVQRHAVVDGLAITSAAVPEGREVDLDLVVEAIGDDLVVTGSITFPWVGECRRCLAEVTSSSSVRLREVFERRPVEGETYQLGDGVVDLEAMVRETVLLALPLAPLCADDCAGPAPERFPATVADDEPDPAARDPRWAALDELTFDDDS